MEQHEAVEAARYAAKRVPADFGIDPGLYFDMLEQQALSTDREHFLRAADHYAAHNTKGSEQRFKAALDATRPTHSGSDKPLATWTQDYVEQRGFQRFAIRDWLVNRTQWPLMGGPEPDQPGFSWKSQAIEELKRADRVLLSGNAGDYSGSEAAIDASRYARLKKAMSYSSKVSLGDPGRSTAQERMDP